VINDVPLVPEAPPRPSFAKRIQRANELAERYLAASEVLAYYGRLAFHQEQIYQSCLPSDESNFADLFPMLIEAVLPAFPEFARSLAQFAPEPLRDRATALARADFQQQHELLSGVTHGEVKELAAADHFIALAFLQPCAERLAETELPSMAKPQTTCPVCASEAICSVLRDRGQGAGRSLVCSLCMNEWSFLRVACPACGEERFESLPVYTPEQDSHLRIDACDTCRHYIKTIDMTKDGLAVPIVDELAGVTLDLWANQNGYRKLTRNVAGL
jgi:FdhE protein